MNFIFRTLHNIAHKRAKRTFTNRNQFPECLKPIKQLTHLTINGCGCGGFVFEPKARSIYGMKAGDSIAHAMLMANGERHICMVCYESVGNEKLMLHEAGHLIVDFGVHTPAWAKCVLDIGGTLDPITIGNKKTIDYNGCLVDGEETVNRFLREKVKR